MKKELPSHLQSLCLPSTDAIAILSGKAEEIVPNEYCATEGGALWGVPDQEKWWGVVHHSILVRRHAMILARWLNEVHVNDISWKKLDVHIIGDVALLEDFAKRYEKEAPYGTKNHGTEALRILKNVPLEHKEEIVRGITTHMYGVEEFNEPPSNWADIILFLADHYTTHEVITLEERIRDYLDRREKKEVTYQTPEGIEKTIVLAFQLQQKLLNELGISEEMLIQRLKALPQTYEETKLRAILQRPYEKAAKTIEAVKRLQRWQKQKKARSQT